MLTINKHIFAMVYAQFEAVHCWKMAPPTEDYLRYPHRHMFKVKIYIEQKHDNRDIEYYNFKKWIQGYINYMDKPLEFSCEQYAEQIYYHIAELYPDREISIEVTEDGLEGALVKFKRSTHVT